MIVERVSGCWWAECPDGVESADMVGDEVMNILRIAQAQVGAMVPGREVAPETCALYSRHAGELADGLLGRLPVRELPLSLRGFRLESDLGM